MFVATPPPAIINCLSILRERLDLMTPPSLCEQSIEGHSLVKILH